MKKKWINSMFCLFLVCGTAFSQECECPQVPDDAFWGTEREFKESEREVRKCLDWLGSQGLTECVSHRESLNSYVLLWLSECPYLTVHLQPQALPFLKEYPDLLFVMIHGMAAYQLANPKDLDPKSIHAGGLDYLTRVLKNTKTFDGKRDFKELQK